MNYAVTGIEKTILWTCRKMGHVCQNSWQVTASVLQVNSLGLVSTNLLSTNILIVQSLMWFQKQMARCAPFFYHYIGLENWQDAAWYWGLKNPNTIEDIETFIDEHRQHHPEVPDDQGEASHRELEELSTLEEEKISGRGPSTKGRRVNDLPKSVKVTERGTLRSLPKQKIKRLKQKYSLVEAVRSNKSSAKNHTAHNVNNVFFSI